MKYLISLFSLLFFISAANASDFCSDMQKKADREQAYIDHSTSDYKVISKGRLYFYSAPDKKCKNSKVFLVPGDHVIVYSIYNGFLSAAYFKSNGDSVDGWLDTSQLENTKLTNGPSSEEQMVFNMLPEIIQRNKLSSLSRDCLSFNMSNSKNYYSVVVSKSADEKCESEKTLPFTLLIKKHTLDAYTNQGGESDEFRPLKNN